MQQVCVINHDLLQCATALKVFEVLVKGQIVEDDLAAEAFHPRGEGPRRAIEHEGWEPSSARFAWQT